MESRQSPLNILKFSPLCVLSLASAAEMWQMQWRGTKRKYIWMACSLRSKPQNSEDCGRARTVKAVFREQLKLTFKSKQTILSLN